MRDTRPDSFPSRPFYVPYTKRHVLPVPSLFFRFFLFERESGHCDRRLAAKVIVNGRLVFPFITHRELNISAIILTAVAPEIVPFIIGEGPANWGDTVTATCTVLKGDHPVQIEWALNGEPIPRNHYDISIVNTSKRVSVLTIDAVTAGHAGEYTCSVSNAAGGTSYSATLAVNGTTSSRILSLPTSLRCSIFISCMHATVHYPCRFLRSCASKRRGGPSRRASQA